MLVAQVTALALVLPSFAVAWPQAAGLPALVAPEAEGPAAAPGQSAPIFASVKVDAEGFGEVGSKVQVRVAQEAESVLLSEGIKRRSGVSDMVVYLKVTPPANGDEGYVLGLAVNHLGKPIGEITEVACELCVEDELIEKVAAKVRELVPTMRDHMAKIASDDAAAEDQKRRDEEERRRKAEEEARLKAEQDKLNNQDQPEPARFGGKGKAGLGLIAGGVVGLGVGVGLALRQPTQKDPTIGYELLDTHQPGYALIGVGGALAITGAVLLVLDSRERQRKLEKNNVAPVAGPGTVGLVWSGRF